MKYLVCALAGLMSGATCGFLTIMPKPNYYTEPECLRAYRIGGLIGLMTPLTFAYLFISWLIGVFQ